MNYLFLLMAMANTQKQEKPIEETSAPQTTAIMRDKRPNQVRVGQYFEIAQQSNPSTGYFWTYKISEPDAFKFISATDFSDDIPLVGRPSIRIWRFKALKRGHYYITFTMQKSRQKPEKVRKYEIIVR